MPNTEITTPTTQAMPITTTLDAPIRLGMLLTFIAVTAPICQTYPCDSFLRAPTRRECVHDVERLRAPRGQHRADHGQRRREGEAGTDHAPRQPQAAGADQPVDRRLREIRHREAEAGGERANQQGFAEHEADHGPVAEAVGLEHRELGNALAHRLHHRVAGQEQQHEGDSAEHHVGKEVDVADPVDAGFA
jgi:hypothetical protein